jgi:DNA-binding SARP family transcriptional activator
VWEHGTYVRCHQLATLVQGYRRGAGLTQRELAAKSGLSVAALRDIEQSRRRRPRARSLVALANALGLDAVQTGQLVSAGRGPKGTGHEPATQATHAERGGRHNGLWVSVLGPLEAWRDGKPLSLGPPARRALLGLLLMEPNVLVRRDTMIDVLWNDTPPPTAVGLVQAHISRLRRVLESPGRRTDRGVLIDSVGAAYRSRLLTDQVDLLTFKDLSTRAVEARARGDDVTAYRLYDEAVGLHRGDPLSDLDMIIGHPGAIMLRQQLTSVVLGYADVAFSLGRHRAAVQRLLAVTAAEPLNEPAHARLMIGLAGLGQQAAAIRVYEDLRSRLDWELGLYPSEQLVDAHMRVLRRDVAARRARPQQ